MTYYIDISVQTSNLFLLKNHNGFGTMLQKQGFNMPTLPIAHPGHLNSQFHQIHFSFNISNTISKIRKKMQYSFMQSEDPVNEQ